MVRAHWYLGRRRTSTGEVVLDLLDGVGRESESALLAETARLGEWLDGVRVLPRFRSPLARSRA